MMWWRFPNLVPNHQLNETHSFLPKFSVKDTPVPGPTTTEAASEAMLFPAQVHSRKLTWIPKMMGLAKGNGSLKKWQFLVSMLDFWGVNLLNLAPWLLHSLTLWPFQKPPTMACCFEKQIFWPAVFLGCDFG